MGRMGITRGLSTWKFQDNYVERVMDNAAYTAAHPDDTLIMAGPPRTPDVKKGQKPDDKLLAIGHLQQVQFTQQKPTQPVMAIGSGRTFFVSGKAQGQCTLGRLFVNGRNLLRVLHHNARSTTGFDVSQFDDRPAKATSKQYYINLDSELYLIPFGLGAMFRDKVHHVLGGFYSELSMITTYAIGLTAGQNMVMEQVNVVFDRLLPYFEQPFTDSYAFTATTQNAIMGFVDSTTADLESQNDGITKKAIPD